MKEEKEEICSQLPREVSNIAISEHSGVSNTDEPQFSKILNVADTICEQDLQFPSKIASNILDVCTGIFDKQLVLPDMVIDENEVRSDMTLPDNVVINYSDVGTEICSDSSENHLNTHAVHPEIDKDDTTYMNSYVNSSFMPSKPQNLNALSVITSNFNINDSDLNITPSTRNSYVRVISGNNGSHSMLDPTRPCNSACGSMVPISGIHAPLPSSSIISNSQNYSSPILSFNLSNRFWLESIFCLSN